MNRSSNRSASLVLACSLALAAAARADGEILSFQQITDTVGGLGAVLDAGDRFGESVDRIGDLDGDGNVDLAVGAPGDDDVATDSGAVWILFLSDDGTVWKRTKIVLGARTELGLAVSRAGDFNGDGIIDLLVGSNEGVDVLEMHADGTATHREHIDAGFVFGGLPADTAFGSALSALNDLDGDGRIEIAIGDPHDDTGTIDTGAVYVFELDAFGAATYVSKIASSTGGFLGSLSFVDWFGYALETLDDLDGDGVSELAVGAPKDDDGGTNHGAVWILFLNPNGTVKSEQKISASFGAPPHLCASTSLFGSAIARVGDFDGNAGPELLVASENEGAAGAAWLLFLETDGTVRSYVEYEPLGIGLAGVDDDWRFGTEVCAMSDHDGDGLKELVVGAPGHDASGLSGSLFVLFPAAVHPAEITFHGCDLAPAGSLKLSGDPILGSDFSFLVDNPIGSQNAGSIPFVAISAVDVTSPCGLPVPGFSMDPANPNGELLVLPPFVAPELVGAPWTGPGSPVAIPVALPQMPELLGASLFAQGLMFDPSGGPGGTVQFALTRGRELVIGS